MSWTAPRTWVTGETLTSTLLNTHLRDNLISLRPGYGTTLPGSPGDGDEFVLVDSVTLPTWQWQLRYNGSSTNADKWESIGATPIAAHANATLTLPRAGVYRVTLTGLMSPSTATVGAPVATVTPSSGSVTGRNSIQAQIGVPVGGTYTISADVSSQFTVAGVAAAATLPWSGNTAQLSNGCISAVPIRLS